MIGGLIGGAASIIAGMLQADQQERASKRQFAFDMYNTQRQDNARRDAMNYADEIRGEQKLGGYDAMGNRTYFDELDGWKIDKGDLTKELEAYFYGRELPEMRQQFDRKASSVREYDQTRDALLDQFRRTERENPTDLANELYATATRGQSDSNRENMETSALMARQKGLKSDPNLQSFIEASAKARGDVAASSKLQAKDFVDQNYNNERSNTSKLLAMFNQMANDPLLATLDAPAMGDGANRNLPSMMQLLQQGNAQGFNANMKDPARLDYKHYPVDYSFIGDAGGRIGAGLDQFAQQSRQDAKERAGNQFMIDYASLGGRNNLYRGGMLGHMIDRSARMGRTGGTRLF